MKEKAIQLREALERINEDLLALSDDIWLNIDHNDAQGLEKGVAFKKAFIMVNKVALRTHHRALSKS